MKYWTGGEQPGNPIPPMVPSLDGRFILLTGENPAVLDAQLLRPVIDTGNEVTKTSPSNHPAARTLRLVASLEPDGIIDHFLGHRGQHYLLFGNRMKWTDPTDAATSVAMGDQSLRHICRALPTSESDAP